MNTLRDSTSKLIVDGFSPFAFDQLRKEDHEELMMLSKRITSQNPGFIYCTDYGLVPDNKTDRGITRREPLNGQDGKWLTQYRPSLRRELCTKLGTNTLPPEIEEWLQKAKYIYTTLLNFSKEIIKDVDQQIPEYNIYKQYTDVEAEDLHMLRSVQYDPSVKRRPVADKHCDYSLITLAGYQSYPGLWLRTKEKKRIDYLPKENEIMVFWGRKAPTISQGLLRKVEHGAHVPKTQVQRDAGIFFGHADVPMAA